MKFSIFCDGACKPNPGIMGIGVVIKDESGQRVHAISKKLGEGTNNVAEYTSIIEALKYMLAHYAGAEITICMDSQLVVRQVNGEYSVNDKLLNLHGAVKLLLGKFKWSIKHIPREQNAEADALAQEAYV